MFCSTDDSGQATVEAAVLIPVLFVLMLMLIQPGIILYDRIVMQGAAAEGCRALATRCPDSGMTEQRLRELVKRHLGSIPQHDLFHVHGGECSWDIRLEGDEHSSQVRVIIGHKIKPVPLFDAAFALAGMVDDEGYLGIRVEQFGQAQPLWALSDSGQADPGGWTKER